MTSVADHGLRTSLVLVPIRRLVVELGLPVLIVFFAASHSGIAGAPTACEEAASPPHYPKLRLPGGGAGPAVVGRPPREAAAAHDRASCPAGLAAETLS